MMVIEIIIGVLGTLAALFVAVLFAAGKKCADEDLEDHDG